jgi:hypothetical protein
MGKYRSKDISESVREITVKWAAEGRDSRVFVKETLVTEENIEPVLRMMAVGVGKDVFDVKVKVQKKKTEEKKTDEKKTKEKRTKENKTEEKKTEENKTEEKKTEESKAVERLKGGGGRK